GGTMFGCTPRSSTGQFFTSFWPGGKRLRCCSSGMPVSKRPSLAHSCFELMNLSLILPISAGLSSSSDMGLTFGSHQARLVAGPVARLLALALVVEFLALGDAKLDLGNTFEIEIDLQGHERHALALHRG